MATVKIETTRTDGEKMFVWLPDVQRVQLMQTIPKPTAECSWPMPDYAYEDLVGTNSPWPGMGLIQVWYAPTTYSADKGVGTILCYLVERAWLMSDDGQTIDRIVP